MERFRLRSGSRLDFGTPGRVEEGDTFHCASAPLATTSAETIGKQNRRGAARWVVGLGTTLQEHTENLSALFLCERNEPGPGRRRCHSALGVSASGLSFHSASRVTLINGVMNQLGHRHVFVVRADFWVVASRCVQAAAEVAQNNTI